MGWDLCQTYNSAERICQKVRCDLPTFHPTQGRMGGYNENFDLANNWLSLVLDGQPSKIITAYNNILMVS